MGDIHRLWETFSDCGQPSGAVDTLAKKRGWIRTVASVDNHSSRLRCILTGLDKRMAASAFVGDHSSVWLSTLWETATDHVGNGKTL